MSPTLAASPWSTAMVMVVSVMIFFLMINKIDTAKYNLPSGVQKQVEIDNLKETFNCEADGYFADVDNDCKIYHQCNSYNKKGKPVGKFSLTTYGCGKGQVFDQSKLSCQLKDEAIPCEASSDFFYLNERIGNETADFLTDADIEKARNARPEYRARARRSKSKRKISRRSKLKRDRSSSIELMNMSDSNVVIMLKHIQDLFTDQQHASSNIETIQNIAHPEMRPFKKNRRSRRSKSKRMISKKFKKSNKSKSKKYLKDKKRTRSRRELVTLNMDDPRIRQAFQFLFSRFSG